MPSQRFRGQVGAILELLKFYFFIANNFYRLLCDHYDLTMNLNSTVDSAGKLQPCCRPRGNPTLGMKSYQSNRKMLNYFFFKSLVIFLGMS